MVQVLIATLLTLVVAGCSFLFQWQAASLASQELNELKASIKHNQTQAAKNGAGENAAVTLPKFRGAQLVSSLNRLAVEQNLTLDEVAYSLDDSNTQPFMRYRITMSAKANYATIKRFASRLSGKMTNVALDGISCARDDVGIAVLTCDLTFSAFYQKDSRG